MLYSYGDNQYKTVYSIYKTVALQMKWKTPKRIYFITWVCEEESQVVEWNWIKIEYHFLSSGALGIFEGSIKLLYDSKSPFLMMAQFTSGFWRLEIKASWVDSLARSFLKLRLRIVSEEIALPIHPHYHQTQTLTSEDGSSLLMTDC